MDRTIGATEGLLPAEDLGKAAFCALVAHAQQKVGRRCPRPAHSAWGARVKTEADVIKAMRSAPAYRFLSRPTVLDLHREWMPTEKLEPELAAAHRWAHPRPLHLHIVMVFGVHGVRVPGSAPPRRKTAKSLGQLGPKNVATAIDSQLTTAGSEGRGRAQKLSDDAIAERRAEIVEAAVLVFAERGYAGAQISNVAQSLGIGHGTIYRHFVDKKDLYAEVVRYAIARIGAVVTVSPSAETIEDYLAQVRHQGQQLFEMTIAEPALAKLILTEAPASDPEVAELVEQAFQALDGITELYLEHGKKRGYFRTDFNTRIAARALNVMTLEGMRQVLRSSEPLKTKREWLDQIPELFILGVAR